MWKDRRRKKGNKHTTSPPISPNHDKETKVAFGFMPIEKKTMVVIMRTNKKQKHHVKLGRIEVSQ